MSHGWRGGSSYAWRRVRRRVLAQNTIDHRGLCNLEIPGVCTGLATQVHHTHGITVTGMDPRYLMAVCRPCNLHVGDPTTAPNPSAPPLETW